MSTLGLERVQGRTNRLLVHCFLGCKDQNKPLAICLYCMLVREGQPLFAVPVYLHAQFEHRIPIFLACG